MSTIEEIILGAAQRYGIDPQTMLAIGHIESPGLNPRAQNPHSTAGGLFQFIDSTWGQYGRGADKYDPVANADAAGRYLADVQRHLSRVLGRAPTAGELYLGHQQGAGGASKLLSNPNAPAASLVGADAVRLNGANLNASSAEFARLWSDKIDRVLKGIKGGPSIASAYGGGQPQAATSDLVDRGQLAGADPQSFAGSLVDRGQLAGTAPGSLLQQLYAGPVQKAKERSFEEESAEMARKAALAASLPY